ncbi:carboxymuconolactone decarboxylase family protein [bacterium]|nr:carboxymuconolactone decarboxylase family protein [bacterium]
MENPIKNWQDERKRLTDQLTEFSGTNMKRLLGIDNAVYRKGVLPAKTKELLGLVSSTVLRCDDCILYHLIQCHEAGVTTAEIEECFTIAWTVGGSITIPHIRRAVDSWMELTSGDESNSE